MFSDQLIREINTVFHEVESKDYDERHPEVLRDERNNWSNLAKMIFAIISFFPVPIKYYRANTYSLSDIGES